MKSFKQFIKEEKLPREMLPTIDAIYIHKRGEEYTCFEEGKEIDGRFKRNIRLDKPTYGAGQEHAHVHARNGNKLGIINFDGSGSHGSKFKIHANDAKALEVRGYTIPDDRIVEWCSIEGLQFIFLV